ncbi:MAG: hypothetical protein U0U46_17905 [Saprospiraceae bacterium]
MKTYVSFEFKSALGEAGLTQFAVNVLSRMKGNPKFASLKNHVETDLQLASDRFAAAILEAADGSRTRIAEKRMRRQELLDVLERIAVQLIVLADGDESVILDAGFNPRRRTGQRTDGTPDQVTGLRASSGYRPGEVLLEYNAAARARMYGVEWSTDQGASWHNGIYPSARRAVVTGLPSRQEVWFRVFAMGTQQRKGAPSNPLPYFVQ